MDAYDDNSFGQSYGGGYDDVRGGGGGFFGSREGGDMGERNVGSDSLRPVTARLVLNAKQPNSDSAHVFDGAVLNRLTMVGWLRQINRTATFIQYTLDDGTGQLDLRQWIDNSLDEGSKADEFAPNEYVRVMGEIKTFNNKLYIALGAMNKLQDHNEYLYHQLDVIYTHLQLTKGSGAAATNKASQPGGVDASVYDDSAMQTADSMASDLSHLTPLQRRIYQAINAEAPDWPEGVDIQQIIQRCKNTDPAQIQDAIDDLANDGFIYQASDETHYLTTAG